MATVGAQWLNSLQVLRFLAALAVVLFHTGSGLQMEHPDWANPFSLGYAGVDVFFVLSGFIMAHTVRPERGAWDFSARRIARIVPLYWFLTLALFAVTLLAPALLNSPNASFGELASSLVFVPYVKDSGAVQPLLFLGWTLCYEMFFYLIYAVAIAISGRLFAGEGTEKVLVAGCLALCIAVGFIVPDRNALAGFYTSPILAEFIFGIALCEALRRWPIHQRSFGLAGALVLIAGLLFLILQGLPRPIALGIPAVIVVAAFVLMPEAKSTSFRGMVLLGNASYSLYLIHPYCIQLPIKLSARLGGPLLMVGAASLGALAALVASIFLYQMLEKPAQKAILRSLLPGRMAAGPKTSTSLLKP